MEEDQFLEKLRGLSIRGLLIFYIEAKTGCWEDITRVPPPYMKMLDDLGSRINTFYAERIIEEIVEGEERGPSSS